jgi:hypothetical protein
MDVTVNVILTLESAGRYVPSCAADVTSVYQFLAWSESYQEHLSQTDAQLRPI